MLIIAKDLSGSGKAVSVFISGEDKQKKNLPRRAHATKDN